MFEKKEISLKNKLLFICDYYKKYLDSKKFINDDLEGKASYVDLSSFLSTQKTLLDNMKSYIDKNFLNMGNKKDEYNYDNIKKYLDEIAISDLGNGKYPQNTNRFFSNIRDDLVSFVAGLDPKKTENYNYVKAFFERLYLYADNVSLFYKKECSKKYYLDSVYNRVSNKNRDQYKDINL